MLDRLEIAAHLGNRVQLADLAAHPVEHLKQTGLSRSRMLCKTRAHRFPDLLRGKGFVIPQRNLVPVPKQKVQDIHVILARLRPVDKEPRPGPLAQRIVDVFGKIREHAKGAIAPHHRIRTGKALRR